MWTKEECAGFLKKVLGLELTDVELEDFWTYLNEHQITPLSSSGGNTVAFTPQGLQNLINIARERTGLSLQDSRFKKVAEEIMPAFAFTLFLKKDTGVEHLIVSSDVPDIILIPRDQSVFGSNGKRLGAFPLEAMFINKYAMQSVSGSSDVEKIANLIISRKFSKNYVPETSLLVTLATDLEKFNRKQLSDLLVANGTNPFSQIWIFAGIDQDNSLIAQILPLSKEEIVSASKDLWSLMY